MYNWVQYSGDLKTEHSNIGNIRKPDIFDIRFSNGRKCPVFEWSGQKTSGFRRVWEKNVRFSNVIRKSDHLLSDLLSTIQNPNMSGFLIPTVFECSYRWNLGHYFVRYSVESSIQIITYFSSTVKLFSKTNLILQSNLSLLLIPSSIKLVLKASFVQPYAFLSENNWQTNI